jgi:hypothetical protein
VDLSVSFLALRGSAKATASHGLSVNEVDDLRALLRERLGADNHEQ